MYSAFESQRRLQKEEGNALLHFIVAYYFICPERALFLNKLYFIICNVYSLL